MTGLLFIKLELSALKYTGVRLWKEMAEVRHPFRKTLPSATFPKLERAQVKKVEKTKKNTELCSAASYKAWSAPNLLSLRFSLWRNIS